ncbi:MAG: acyl-CoA dehydrogenase family protein [bacterium]
MDNREVNLPIPYPLLLGYSEPVMCSLQVLPMFELPVRALEIKAQVESFFEERILPNNKIWIEQATSGQPIPAVELELREEAQQLGLWNMALPRLTDDEPGTRLTNLEFTAVAEVLGRLEWASRVFNCHAPDVPNMELLQLFASEAQKDTWLNPLLAGEFGSAFAMTEPEVASSDPANLETSITRDGDEYVINGRKWFASNASHEKCRLIILVGVTDPDAAKSRRQSLILIPRDSDGIEFVRNIPVFEHTSVTNLHPELELNDVRVPVDNLLGEPGAGFAMGQARLGPARLHHCMRAIGECEVLISLMVKRSTERTTFGKRIDEYSSTQESISLSRIELDQCRLLVQRAAHLLDTVGNKVARKQISMIKVAVARTYQSIADRTVQLYGAKGVTSDTPAARAFNKARAFRIYDGPDEVHLQTIARLESNEQSGQGLEHYLS